jgi:dihydropteroate synthase
MRTVDAAGLLIGDDQPPRIMGVLNVSEESPYDPSVYSDHGRAATYVDEELIDNGADIVDIGLESANKRLDVLSPDQELDRLDTAVETIESVSGEAVFSIETRYAEVATAALDRGFDMVNDICGFADPEMPEVCREYDVAVGKMASPPDLSAPGAVDEVDWAEVRSPEWAASADYVDQLYEGLKQNGLTEKTIVDPAFGGWSENKTLADDRETFRRLPEFRALGQPILVSINRKNFLRKLVDRSTEEALPVSLAATSMAVERGANVVRTHDVAETRDAALIGDAFSERTVVDGDSVRATELVVPDPRTASRYLERTDGGGGADRPPSRVVEIAGLTSEQVATVVETTRRSCAVVRRSDGVLLIGGSVDALLTTADKLPDRDLYEPIVEVLGAGG